MRRAGSGGGGQAGGGLELIHEGLEQQDNQVMSQNIGPGGLFVRTRRTLQSDQTFETLEGEFDAPAQAIQGENIGGRELLC